MSPQKKWSFKCGVFGGRVQVGERRWGGSVDLRTWKRSINGYTKKSLRFPVRSASGRLIPEAVTRAKREALALAHRLAQGDPSEKEVTLGFVAMLFPVSLQLF